MTDTFHLKMNYKITIALLFFLTACQSSEPGQKVPEQKIDHGIPRVVDDNEKLRNEDSLVRRIITK